MYKCVVPTDVLNNFFHADLALFLNFEQNKPRVYIYKKCSFSKFVFCRYLALSVACVINETATFQSYALEIYHTYIVRVSKIDINISQIGAAK